MTLEHIVLGIISTAIGVIMSDATWALLIGQFGIIAIMIVKDRRDLKNREQDRLDRESAAKLARNEIAQVNAAGGEREGRIVAEVQEVKKAVVETLGQNTVPGIDAEHPVHLKVAKETPKSR